jgi:CBS domain-containing protein
MSDDAPEPMKVGDIMTREVYTLFEEENLASIEEGMESYRFRHLPVIDDGKLVGLVTIRDILRASASSLEVGHEDKTRQLRERFFVRDIMTSDVETVKEDTLLVDAATTMRDKKLGCLPVVADGGQLVGIITESDFVRLSIRFLMRS